MVSQVSQYQMTAFRCDNCGKMELGEPFHSTRTIEQQLSGEFKPGPMHLFSHDWCTRCVQAMADALLKRRTKKAVKK